MIHHFIFALPIENISPFFAYIDPGTGSLLMATIIGLGMAVVFSMKGLFYKLVHLMTGRVTVNRVEYTGKLVFYSEGKNYWNVFKPVIDELVKAKQPMVYLTSDNDDPGLNYNSELLDSHYLGSITYSIACLNKLKADTVVMTTPQLGVLMLKRSPHVRHYAHLLHAPTDIHTYEKFAFDDFDSVFCSSTFQIENIRQLETQRKTTPKQLFETGCTYYDSMDVQPRKQSKDKTILIAPTWGEKSFLKRCGEQVIEKVLHAGYQVIFRPHPQSFISDKKLIESLLNKFTDNSSFVLDRAPDNSESLAKASCMITDISGIIYDFAFLYKKPVLAFDIQWNKGGFEASDILNKQAEYGLLQNVGHLVTTGDIEHICELIQTAEQRVISQELIDRYIFNFPHAGAVAAKQILDIYKSKG
jgi:CDP-Glycerol:Poly(glycerophosphate) glycerophosphotransferase